MMKYDINNNPPKKRHDIFFKWYISTIRYYLHDAYNHFEKNYDKTDKELITKEGLLNDNELIHWSKDLVIESTILLLNNLIETIIQSIAIKIGEYDLDTIKNINRFEQISIIESKCNIKLNTISGWTHVEKIRKDANLLKHNTGFKIIPSSNGVMEIQKVKRSVEELDKSISIIEKWFIKFIDLTNDI